MDSLTELPKAITKEILFKKAQERFSSWANMYANHDVTVGQMYDDMTCAVFSGDPKYDFGTRETKSILDPKEQMQMYLDDLCPFKLRQEVSQPEFWQYYDNLRKNIGEAMGPVSYAAFGLARYIDEHDILLGTKWVWDFVKHYEKNWKF